MAKRKSRRRAKSTTSSPMLLKRLGDWGKRLKKALRTLGSALGAFLARWKAETLGVVLVALCALTVISLLGPGRARVTGQWLRLLRLAFGQGVYLVPLLLLLGGGWLLTARLRQEGLLRPWRRLLGSLLLYLSIQGMLHHLSLTASPRELAGSGGGGGYLGLALSDTLRRAFGFWGAYLILTGAGLGGLALASAWSPRGLAQALVEGWRELIALLRQVRLPSRRRPPPEPGLILRPKVRKRKRPPRREAVVETVEAAKPEEKAEPRPTPQRWELPPLAEVLDEAVVEELSDAELDVRARIIEETMVNFGVPVQVVGINRGPTVTQFALKPGYMERRTSNGKVRRAKVRVSKITSLANDLALALSAAPVRMEAPVPGRPYVGLEVPNSQVSLVELRPVMESPAFKALDSPLRLALGRDVSGEPVIADLAAMPHLLIAGATGSGKSVCIHSLVTCLLCQNSPDELKLVLVDPKRVELVAYDGIPHLQVPVVTELENVLGILHWASRQMDGRFKEFVQAGVRNIEGYNQRKLGSTRMPNIVIVVDELADLMALAPYDVERTICRLAQMARATGIHLVLATQRPSVDVVTGLIKANFPARISFAVTSQVDSRVILDTPGAEKLLGRGDMLYMASDSSKIVRLQGCFVSNEETKRLVRFWKRAAATRDFPVEAPFPLAAIQSEGAATPEEDKLLGETIALVKGHRRASISFLQRKLRIGYPRAARLVDMLEERGIVGPDEGGGRSREVLVGHEAEDEEATDNSLDE